MRVAIALGGTDGGRSGLGTYTHAVLPRLIARLGHEGGDLVALGTDDEFEAYAPSLCGAHRRRLSGLWRRPGASAALHLGFVGHEARRAGADVLLLPAANRRVAATSPLPTVAVVHDLAPLRVAGKYDRLRTAYVRHAVVGALRAQTVLVAVSRATQRDIDRAIGRGAPPVRVIPNGVDAVRFQPGPPGRALGELPPALGLDRPYVLYVSRLEHPGKNHLRLLRAFACSGLAESHDLALAGPDWGAREAIASEGRALGLGDRVKLLGRVDDALLPPLTALADAAVMVGLCEGFGLPALEALACGTPVLVANAGALPEVAGPFGVLCDPLDESDIARGLLEITTNARVRDRARRSGPAWARAHDWDAVASAIVQALNDARAA